MASNGHVYDALKELESLAKKNNLKQELESLAKIKENLRFIDARLQNDFFGETARSEETFKLIDLIDNLEEMEDLEVGFHSEKAVNLLLDPSLGLNEEKRNALLKTVGKILGVKSENIAIEQMATW